MLVDSNGLWPEWVSKVAKAAEIVVTAAVVVAATVATAGAAGAAIGIAAGMAVGSTAVVGTVATVATGFIYGVAGYVGATAVSDTIEVFSGYNPIRDFVFRGNSKLYDTTKILAYGAAAGFIEIGSQNYGLYNPPTVNRSDKRLLNEMTNDEISKLTVDEIKEALPEGWRFYSNNGRIHVKDVFKTTRIRIDPPDSTTQYTHMHICDEFSNPLDIGGKIVDRKHPSAHIPWNGKDR